LRVDASLYFANAAFLRDELERIAHDGSARVMVLDLSAVNDVDVSAVSALEEGAAALAARGVSLRLARVKGPVGDVLGRAGFLAKVPAYETVHEAATAA
jgi:SulP family sulfate permease